jgi:hypothetical protein
MPARADRRIGPQDARGAGKGGQSWDKPARHGKANAEHKAQSKGK